MYDVLLVKYYFAYFLPILPLKKPHCLRLGPCCVNCSSLVQQRRPCVTSPGLLDPGAHVVSDVTVVFIELLNPLNVYVYLSSMFIYHLYYNLVCVRQLQSLRKHLSVDPAVLGLLV